MSETAGGEHSIKPAAQEEIYISPDDLAERFSVNVETIRRQLKAGIVPGKKIGRQWRVRVSEYVAAIDKLQNSRKKAA